MRWRLWHHVMIGALTVVATVARGADEAPEYEVKAEFIERFTQFIDWPSDAFASDDAPFVLCVMGRNPFGQYLESLVRTSKLKGRAAEVRYLRELAANERCHVLFIARDERKRIDAILAQTRDRPILTIGDSRGFAQAGALINFYTAEQQEIRFEINAEAVQKSGLKFSSQLMKLARIVEEGD